MKCLISYLYAAILAGAISCGLLFTYGLTTNLLQPAPTITIWVHGTKSTVRNIPFDTFKRFFDCKPGLNHARTLCACHHHRQIAEVLIAHDPIRFPAEHFYLFGWSGKLSYQEREDTARILYNEIKALIARYKNQYWTVPKIRIITHSHGGNVALNLAKVKDITDTDFVIDELVLLACPVQIKTVTFIKDPVFKKIYSLYSTRDFIQILDPQEVVNNLKEKRFPLFSQRKFPDQPNLRQIVVKRKKRAISHVEFMLEKFLTTLPTILNDEASTTPKPSEVLNILV
ncbi:MAG: hypothetical protein ACHQVS_00330 [Candidatus Babeliales bacterium]